MQWLLNPDRDQWEGQCQNCAWFNCADNDEPCVMCDGTSTDKSEHRPCYFNAKRIDSPDVERIVDDMLTGVKDKAGKPQMRLILPKAATALVRVREYGLRKYPNADNWRNVPHDDWLDALLRHLMAYLSGERIDNESGLPHLWHALANLSYMKEIRLIELFGGIGAQASALENLAAAGKLPHGFTVHRYVEWDKYAAQSYNAMHGSDFTTTDINDVSGDDLGITDKDKYFYIMFYSFPCTDLSVAGKMAGMSEGSGSRSALLWQVKRLLQETKQLPQMLVMENVTQVHSSRNESDWRKWLSFLESLGYQNYWQDMNAKDYGDIAQSRNRTFLVSLLDHMTYTFPKPIPLTHKMKDYLEDRVDEKYYITNDKAKILIDKLIEGGKILRTNERTNERTTKDSERIVEIHPVHLNMNEEKNVDTEVANTICSRISQGITGFTREWDNGAVEVSTVLVKQATNLTTKNIPSVLEKWIWEVDGVRYLIRIRKLTPKECLRLMGFSDRQYQAAHDAGLSNTQLYKQAGNSICVPVLERLFDQML